MIFNSTRFEKLQKRVKEIEEDYDNILTHLWCQNRFNHKDVKRLTTKTEALAKLLRSLEQAMRPIRR
jgi:hypothetical protein